MTEGGINTWWTPWWEKVTAPIGAGDGTVPPYNFTDRSGLDDECRAWRWEDWDGDALIINEWGCVRTETECFVQLSERQWAEIAVVAQHLVPIVDKLRGRASDGPDDDGGATGERMPGA